MSSIPITQLGFRFVDVVARSTYKLNVRELKRINQAALQILSNNQLTSREHNIVRQQMVEAKSALTRFQQEHVWRFNVVAATAYCAAGYTYGLPLCEFTIPYAVWALAWQARSAWALGYIRNWHIVDGTDSDEKTTTYKYLVHTVNKPYDILGPIIAGVGSLGCGVFSVQMATSFHMEYAIVPAVASVVCGTAFFAMFHSWVREKQLAKEYETKCLTVE